MGLSLEIGLAEPVTLALVDLEEEVEGVGVLEVLGALESDTPLDAE